MNAVARRHASPVSRAFVGRLRRSATVRGASLAALGNAVWMLTSLLGAVVLSRALGPIGRGEYTAITSPVAVVSWLAAAGAQQSAIYFLAKGKRTARELLATWLIVSAPLALIGIAIGEAVVHFTLSTQSSQVRSLATLYMVCTGLMVVIEPLMGLLVGQRRYGRYAILRISQGGIMLLLCSALFLLRHLSVETAVAAVACSWLISLVLGLTMIGERFQLSSFSLPAAREGFWYGLKAHGNTAASAIALRLDIILLPAFVSSRDLAYYAIATSIAALTPSLVGAAALIVLPTGARDASRRGTVVRNMAVINALTCVIAGVALTVAAAPLISLVYGHSFSDAALVLRFLLPGAVALSVSAVFVNGLLSINRPFLTTVAQLPASVFTVAGLAVLLPRGGGIVAAAAVSSTSYTLTMLTSWALYAISVRRLSSRATNS